MKVTTIRFAAVTAALALWAMPMASKAQSPIDFEPTLPPIPVVVEVKPAPSTQCAAAIGLSYSQSNTVVQVETELENTICVASHGSYQLTVSVRDANGERRVLEFEENWQRSEPGKLEFSREYPIGENVDLLTVRAVRPRCTCDGE